MRKLLGTLVLLAAIVVGFGFWRGWFSFSSEDQPSGAEFKLNVDKEKIQEDRDRVRDSAQKVGDGIKKRLDR